MSQYKTARALEMAVKSAARRSETDTGDRYRDGYSVSVSVTFGGRVMHPISIDLVADEVECDEPDHLAPADRLEIAGLPVCDYPVYPVEAAVVDKLCGILERHDGHPSSRVKDLDQDGELSEVKYNDHWSWIYTLRSNPEDALGEHIWEWAVAVG